MTYKKHKKGKHVLTEIGKGIKKVEKIKKDKIMADGKKQQVKIMIDDKDISGHYSNAVSIMHTPEEFIFDYIFMPPGAGSERPAKLLSRIILSPSHAKRLQLALNDNIAKYESKFGAIELTKDLEKNIQYN